MKNKGFSLVELIVVIAIMAILVGVAVPVYTSYIEKADRAKDDALLDEINQAFAVVCAENNIDLNELTIDTAAITVDENGVVTFDDMLPEACRASMKQILGIVEFNYITGIYFNEQTRQFGTNMVFSYGGGYIVLNAEDIAKLKDSEFGNIGKEELMKKVDLATLAAASTTSGALFDLVYSNPNKQSLAGYLQLEYGSAEYEEAFAMLVLEKTAQLAGMSLEEFIALSDSDPDRYNELLAEYAGAAEAQIYANNAVLIAATHSDFDSASFAESLADGSAVAVIKNTGDGTETALAQTAMAYAMYAAYASSKDQPVSHDVGVVLATLETQEFQEYMSTPEAKADMEGYLAAMNMVNESSKDKNAVSTLLLNGFTDPNLVGRLEQATGN